MFDNIGGKIKGLAKVTAWLGIIASVIYGIVLISQSNRYYNGSALVITGVIVMAAGSLGSWISSFLLYGFGELIDQATQVAINTAKGYAPDGTGAQGINHTASSASVPYSKLPSPKTWECLKCHTTNAQEALFCKECGSMK
jgi:hypothetical protein